MIIFLLIVGLVNLVFLFFNLIQNSNILDALEELLSEKDPRKGIQSVDYEEDLSLRLKEFQKMKFSGINGKKNEK